MGAIKEKILFYGQQFSVRNRYNVATVRLSVAKVLAFIFFLTLANIVAFSSRTSMMFYFTDSIQRLFLDRQFQTTGGIEITYGEIITIDDWWNFMENAFMNGIYSPNENEYNENNENEEKSKKAGISRRNRNRHKHKYGRSHNAALEERLNQDALDDVPAYNNSAWNSSKCNDSSYSNSSYNNSAYNNLACNNSLPTNISHFNTTFRTLLKSSVKLKLLEETIFLGPPRIRQLRVRNNTCQIHHEFRHYFRSCFAPYSFENEDLRGKEQGGLFTWGQLTIYRGGGFMTYLKQSREENVKILRKIKNDKWINRGTRLAIVEFNLYNANTNLFCMVKFISEFPSVGGIVTSRSIRTLSMLFRINTVSEIVITLIKSIFYITVLAWTIFETAQIFLTRLEYFQHFWNWVTVIMLVTANMVLVFWIVRHIAMKKILDEYHKNSNVYVDMDSTVLWQYYLTNAKGIVIFLIWILIFKFISFNKTMLQFVITLKRCAVDLFGFGVMFIIVFIAFAQLGYLLFGAENRDYRTMIDSVFTMMRTILGDFDYLAIERANRLLGPLYFLTYIFFVFFVLLNMFLAIINDTYSEVKAEEPQIDIHVWQYLKDTFRQCCVCLCCGRDIFGKRKDDEDDKGDGEIEPPDESPPLEKEPSDLDRGPQERPIPVHPLQSNIVVRKKDLIGRVFIEVDRNEEPNDPELNNRMDGIENRIENMETVMDNLAFRVNALINRLHSDSNRNV